MNTVIVINILLSFPLLMIIDLIINNNITDNKMSHFYVRAVLLTILELYMEIISNQILFQSGETYVFLNKLINAFGFLLCPFITYNLLAMQLDFEKIKIKKIIKYPLIINAITCIVSMKTGIIFFVNDDNTYHRGSFFGIPLFITMIYLIFFMVLTIGRNSKYNRNDKVHFTIINLAVIIGITIQILYCDIMLIWSTAAVALILYYLILREQQFRYDELTKVQNRFRYNKKISDLVAKPSTLVFIDLNGFKSVNDKYGHNKGDEVLYNAAKLLSDSFKNIGEVFRIGGDEFCIICNELYETNQIDDIFEQIHLITQNNPEDYVISKLFAYGSADYNPSAQISIEETINAADKAMFECKKRMRNTDVGIAK